MTRNNRKRKQKRRVFFGCEGESERAYGQLLNDLLQELELETPVHLDVKLLAPGAGDPLARVKCAVSKIDSERNRRTPYSKRFILLDRDQVKVGSQMTKDPISRAKDTISRARDNNIRLIWQTPCHEALLLHHLPGHADKKPPDSNSAEKRLQAAWPEYNKPMAREKLSRRIGIEEVRQAMSVEPELKAFLQDIGWPKQ